MNICTKCNSRHSDSQCVPCLLKENEALRQEVIDAQKENNYRANYANRIAAELRGERRMIIFDADGHLLRARAMHDDLSDLRDQLKKVTKERDGALNPHPG